MTTPTSLRAAIHLKMLAKSEGAKDLGELTVVPLGFAVDVALELLAAERQAIVDALPEKRLYTSANPEPSGEVYVDDLRENTGYNQAITDVKQIIESRKV